SSIQNYLEPPLKPLGTLNPTNFHNNYTSFKNHTYYSDFKLRTLKRTARRLGLAYRKHRTPGMLRLFQIALAAARERMTELRQTDWEKFVNGLNAHTPLSRAWRDINRIKGNRTGQIAHPHPLHRANELVSAWAATSSYDNLPSTTQAKLNDKYDARERLVCFMLSKADDCNIPFTNYELDAALTKGNSTSPGEDGITYNILRLLCRVPGNPLLELYNMRYVTGELPQSWTNSFIIPIPKPNQQNAFRPISLTSCLCKTFERMILNRLMYRIKQFLSPRLHGFMHGRSVHHCIATFLTLHTDSSYTTFLDLKSAFDVANRHVIISELARMDVGGWLLRWIKGYLSNRKSSVLFQGHRSVTKDFELGTPQGGVLSPTLFNILINALLNAMPSQPHHYVISFADDIMIHTTGFSNTQNILNHVLASCQDLGLIISTDKTKILNRRPPRQRGTVRQIQLHDGSLLEYVSRYRYLGFEVPLLGPVVTRLCRQYEERLRALRVVAGFHPR
ncbi:hypothetical protein OTU49_000617, partial [Cherax quadricarinatus]